MRKRSGREFPSRLGRKTVLFFASSLLNNKRKSQNILILRRYNKIKNLGEFVHEHPIYKWLAILILVFSTAYSLYDWLAPKKAPTRIADAVSSSPKAPSKLPIPAVSDKISQSEDVQGIGRINRASFLLKPRSGTSSIPDLSIPAFINDSQSRYYSIPYIEWNLTNFINDRESSWSSRKDRYSGGYTVTGITGESIYRSMRVHFYGVEGNQVLRWANSVTSGFPLSYNQTGVQNYAAFIIPQRVLICIEYEYDDVPLRSVSQYFVDNMRPNIYFRQGGDLLVDLDKNDRDCEESVKKYTIEKKILSQFSVNQMFGNESEIASSQNYILFSSGSQNNLTALGNNELRQGCIHVLELTIGERFNHDVTRLRDISIRSQTSFNGKTCITGSDSNMTPPFQIGNADKLIVTITDQLSQEGLFTCAVSQSVTPNIFIFSHNYFIAQGKNKDLLPTNFFRRGFTPDKNYCQNFSKWPEGPR